MASGRCKEKALDQEHPGKGSNLAKKVLKRVFSLQSLNLDDRPVKKGTSFPLGMRPPTPSLDTPRDTEITAASLEDKASRKEEEGLRESEAKWRRQRQKATIRHQTALM